MNDIISTKSTFDASWFVGLLDPKWIEQRDRTLAEKREQDGVYAPGVSIGSTLKNLAARRTDIFGSGEETQIGKMVCSWLTHCYAVNPLHALMYELVE